MNAKNDFVDIHYQQSGKSTTTNALGMREMLIYYRGGCGADLP